MNLNIPYLKKCEIDGITSRLLLVLPSFGVCFHCFLSDFLRIPSIEVQKMEAYRRLRYVLASFGVFISKALASFEAFFSVVWGILCLVFTSLSMSYEETTLNFVIKKDQLLEIYDDVFLSLFLKKDF